MESENTGESESENQRKMKSDVVKLNKVLNVILGGGKKKALGVVIYVIYVNPLPLLEPSKMTESS